MSAVSENNATLFNRKPLDNDAQRATLARELRVAQGFTLIFALCNSADERARQISALKAELPDLKIQEVPVRRKIPHLLDVLRATLEEPLPDAVFVYGMENWLRGDSNPRSVPFVLNLNAARNHFSADCPCPLVFWIPEFLFRLLIGGAPDFVSVRSGLYVFSDSSVETREALQTLQTLGLTEASGLLLPEKRQRLEELKELLVQVRSLPKDQHDWQDEVSVLNQLAMMFYVMGRYKEAEPLFDEALALRRQSLPPGHPHISQSLNGLARSYYSLGHYEEAEPLYNEALALRRQSLPPGHPDISQSLNNLATLYVSQGRYKEAEPLFDEALRIMEQALGPEHPNTRVVRRNLKLFLQERQK